MNGHPVVYYLPPDRAVTGLAAVFEASGFLKRLKPKKKLGLKVHFGEAGNDNHLDPAIVRTVAIAASHLNLQPVAVETTALYRGRRQNATEHVRLAREHGFGMDRILVPIDILDGTHGEKYYEVPLDSVLVPVARLARGLRRYRYLVNLARYKGHMLTGFGGCIKNLAMGLAAKAGKLEMHSDSMPHVVPDRCTACGTCADYCPSRAIAFVRHVAAIGPGCTGCGGCLAVCPQGAIAVDWNAASETVQRKMVDYCRAVVSGREVLHFDFAVNITPNCDCNNRTERPATADVGVFASLDPVACEQAAFDRTGDVIRRFWPEIEPSVLLEAAETDGLGRRDHRIEAL